MKIYVVVVAEGSGVLGGVVAFTDKNEALAMFHNSTNRMFTHEFDPIKAFWEMFHDEECSEDLEDCDLTRILVMETGGKEVLAQKTAFSIADL
jgi:hypothetical protein